MEQKMAKATKKLENLESQISMMQTRLHRVSEQLSEISNGSQSLPQPAQEVLVDMQKTVKKSTERLETHLSMNPTRIHRFPHYLRGIGNADGRYVVPSVVAVGPCYHGLPHLQEMQEVKQAAAHCFCRDSGCSIKEVYEKILSIVGDARSCYTRTDDESPVAWPNLSDTMLAEMMFVDGCFLMQFMAHSNKPPLAGFILTSGPAIVKDIFLLENQIPWLVLEALAEFKPLDSLALTWIGRVAQVYFSNGDRKQIPPWIKWLQLSLQIFQTKGRRVPAEKKISISNGELKPPHLLGLLRFMLTYHMPPEKREGKFSPDSSLQSSSAVYLAQIGIKLTSSTATWFPDAKVHKKPLCGRLSLSPLFLNDIVACLLVNLAAMEVAEASAAVNMSSDGYVVTSYLSVLAMLVDREEDVQQLRKRGVLCSHFSNTQTLAFFKSLVPLRLGFNYFSIVKEINEYKRHRPVRIIVYKFLYKNIKIITAVLSLAGVLVGLFKALYSLKQS